VGLDKSHHHRTRTEDPTSTERAFSGGREHGEPKRTRLAVSLENAETDPKGRSAGGAAFFAGSTGRYRPPGGKWDGSWGERPGPGGQGKLGFQEEFLGRKTRWKTRAIRDGKA